MRRGEFIPATSLNLLAAAWIQFQTHDWFAHGREPESTTIEVDLPDGHAWHENPMRVPAHPPGPDPRRRRTRDLPPTYINSESHWWDASGIYGSTPRSSSAASAAFQDGKLVVEDGRLPLDVTTGTALTGFSENWWVGLGMLHTLFTLEHNAICDALKAAHPQMIDDELFGTAQLVNSALIAKIHTVEWTPAIIAHPALKVGMRANWWGLLGERLHRLVGRIGSSEEISGIPGSPADHHGAPYQLTEEFVVGLPAAPAAARRARAALARGRHAASTRWPFDGRSSSRTPRGVRDRRGHARPTSSTPSASSTPARCACTTTPGGCRTSPCPTGVRLDLGAVDIIRDRERGVPRYNEFRRQLHLTPGDDVRRPHRQPGLGRASSRRSTATSSASTCRSACTPRRRPRASASATPRSASSS